MFKPKYRNTDLLLQLLSEIAEAKTKIELSKLSFSNLIRLEKDALVHNTHSSTSIEGNTLSLAIVTLLNDNQEVDAEFTQKQEVINYQIALRWCIKQKSAAFSEEILLSLHKLITAKLLAEEKSGAYKQSKNYIIDSSKAVIHTPPDPKKVPILMKELLHWINNNMQLHPVVVSAIYHHQFVTIHPFADGNGRVARASAQLILYQRQFDPHHLLPLDDYYAADRDKYYEKIQQARDLDYDLTYWVEYVAQGVLKTLKQILRKIKQLNIETTASNLSISPKQEELLDLLRVSASVSSKQLQQKLTVNRSRINQLLAPLIAAKLVVKVGQARATKYYLA